MADPTPKDAPPKDPTPAPSPKPPSPSPKPPSPSPKPPAPSPSASRKPSPAPAPAPSPRPSPSRSSFSFPFHPSDIPSKSPEPSIPPLSVETVTSIIHPESTLSIPVSIPIVDPFGVSIGFSTPAFITSLATTTSNGKTVVVTHILANPTSAPNTSNGNRSFFDDSGKTAGVFLVVGIVITALLFGLFFLFRRRRRKNKQAEWLATLPARQNDDPFKSPRSYSPLMRESSRPTDRNSIWDGRRVPVPEYFASDTPVPRHPPPPPAPLPAPTPQRSPNPVWHSNTPSPPRPPPRNPNHRLNTRVVPVRRSDFDYEDPREPSPVGVAITTDRTEKHERRRSLTSVMSSPSIYPQTLPGEEDNNSEVYEMETRRALPPVPQHQQQSQSQSQSQPQQRMIFPASIRRSESHDPKRTSLNTRVLMLTPPLTDDSEAASPASPDFDRRKMILPASESNAFQKPPRMSMRFDGPYPDLRSSFAR